MSATGQFMVYPFSHHDASLLAAADVTVGDVLLATTILQGTVKGGRRQGRQKKRWGDNVREWTGLEFAKSRRTVENK